jgi:hypothetical protein
MAEATVTTRGQGAGPFWPWSARAAVLAVPVIFIVLLVLLSASRAITDWPGGTSEGAILAGLLLLTLLPLVLVLLGNLAGSGGSVEAFGVGIRFAEASAARQEITVPPRLGLQPGMTLNDSSTAQILETLSDAVRSDVAVLDLEEGTAWWETRLVVLCAGAARLGRPAAIVFVATAGGTRQVFKGWASPDELLRGLLAKRRDLQTAYERAVAIHRQWELAVPPPSDVPGSTPPTLPFAIGPDTAVQHVVFPDGVTRSSLAAEQILALQLGSIEEHKAHGVITATRLAELFDPVLRTRSADLEQGVSDSTWARTILSTTDRFIALTRDERYAGLLPREAAVNDILRALVGTAAPGT